MMQAGTPLLVRADCGVEIGTGHVMRCLALAQAWQDAGGHVTFAMAEQSPAITRRLEAEGFQVTPITASKGSGNDAAQTAGAARTAAAAWIVLDGYHFDAAYQQALRAAGLRLLVLDDFGHCTHYSANLVLNQNSNASESYYSSREPATRLLLGLRFVLLRREFLRWRDQPRATAGLANRLLVSMGGSDPSNLTPTVMASLGRAGIEGLRALIVAGGANSRYAELLAQAKGLGPGIEVRQDVHDMPQRMAEADLAVIAAGGTLWELMFMGCPPMIFARTPLQETIFRGLEAQGALVYLGFEQAVGQDCLAAEIGRLARDAGKRTRLAESGRRLIDGRGPMRVFAAMQEYEAGR